MLTPTLATWLVTLVAAYLAVGLLLGILFVARWVGRLDPVAAHGTIGFRLLILPGAALLWPWVGYRLLRGRR